MTIDHIHDQWLGHPSLLQPENYESTYLQLLNISYTYSPFAEFNTKNHKLNHPPRPVLVQLHKDKSSLQNWGCGHKHAQPEAITMRELYVFKVKTRKNQRRTPCSCFRNFHHRKVLKKTHQSRKIPSVRRTNVSNFFFPFNRGPSSIFLEFKPR